MRSSQSSCTNNSGVCSEMVYFSSNDRIKVLFLKRKTVAIRIEIKENV